MDYKARATKLETLSREDLKRAAKVLKIKGYGNKNKTELIALVMEAGKNIRKAEYDAEAAILKVREALGLLKKQFLTRMKAEMDAFEKELDAISAREPAVAARKTANKSYKDSAEMKQDL